MKKGDRCLIPGVYNTELNEHGHDDGHLVNGGTNGDGDRTWTDRIYPYVDVEALKEEVEELWAAIDSDRRVNETFEVNTERARSLRDARLAATKPKEVWVKMKPTHQAEMLPAPFTYRAETGNRVTAWPHPDDIKETVE